MSEAHGSISRVLVASLAPALTLSVALWSCAGSLTDEQVEALSTGLGQTTTCFGNEDPPAFLSSQDCSQCHLSKTNGTGAAFDVLSADLGSRYDGVIGVCPQELLIDPANPRESTLYQYIDDQVDGCTYHAMPPTGSTITSTDKRCLLTWIDGLDGVDDLNDGTSTGSSVTLAQLQEDIFDPICSACHAGSSAPQGLVLGGVTEAELHATLVSQPSQESGKNYIEPNDPDNSYLYRKITGELDATELECAVSCGSQMPQGQSPLAASLQNEVLSWINGGAL